MNHPRVICLRDHGRVRTFLAGYCFALNMELCEGCRRFLLNRLKCVDELDDGIHVMQHMSCDVCVHHLKQILRK